jgi:hypothetical protein
MTISTIDPATPDPNAVAGLGDDELRALKGAITNQFQGQAGDLYDIPITAGPRAINAVSTKADQATVDALDARVSTNETNIITLTNQGNNQESRIAAIEADYTTAAQAGAIAWPVGSLFVSADGGTPSAKGLPGTWAVVGDGRVLLGDPTVGTEAGSNNVTLAAANIPQHKHQYPTFREDSGLTGNVPAVHRTSPATSFSSVKAGRDASSQEYAIFNTDNGVGLSASPTAIDVRGAHLTVRFYRRTA